MFRARSRTPPWTPLPGTVPGALLAGLLLGLVAGCPAPSVEPDAGPPPDDAGMETPGASDYCESIVDYFCSFYLRCGRMAVADEAACRPVFLEACNARYEPAWVELESAGLLSLSSSGMEQCRAYLDGASCDEVTLELQGPCAALWVGTQQAGEPCGFDVETFTCAPGTACVVDLSLCGVCTTVVADGEGCRSAGVTCAPESFCDDQGACAARKAIGETCASGDRCVLGAVCADGVCAGPAYVQVGDPCDFSARCPYASRCVDGTCVATVALGASCGADSPCDSGSCEGGVCVPLRAPGEACSSAEQCGSGACNQTCAEHPSVCFNP